MKKYLEIISLLIFILNIYGCVSNESNEKKIDMEKKARVYFDGLNYEYDIRVKKDVNELSSIYISKDEMSLEKFQQVRDRLKKDGWVFTREYDGFITYCYNEHNMIEFLYPIPNKIHKNEYGSSIKITDYNNWIIYFVYSNSGVRDCGG